MPSYSVLLRPELARFTPPPALRPARASSLWRWSSPRGGRVLPAGLLFGARTFLGRGLSTDAPAAVRPPPGTDIVLDSNVRSVAGFLPGRMIPPENEWTDEAWPRALGVSVCGPSSVSPFPLRTDSAPEGPPRWPPTPLLGPFIPIRNRNRRCGESSPCPGRRYPACVSRAAGRSPRSRGGPPPCSALAARAPRCTSRCAPAAP